MSVVSSRLYGNPSGRKLEKELLNGKTTTRYWHNGLGCAVMVAAMYLIREIWDASPHIPIRLFEGFVSYKERSMRTDHRGDVELLREVVRDPETFSNSIISADDLSVNPGDQVVSAFKILGLDCGVPAVIKRSIKAIE